MPSEKDKVLANETTIIIHSTLFSCAALVRPKLETEKGEMSFFFLLISSAMHGGNGFAKFSFIFSF